MPGVRMMQVPVDQVVDVIAVRDRLVATRHAVLVAAVVPGTGMVRGAIRRVRIADGNDVLVDVIVVRVMQMAVVQVIDVIVVPHGDVPAVGAVDMVVVAVNRVIG